MYRLFIDLDLALASEICLDRRFQFSCLSLVFFFISATAKSAMLVCGSILKRIKMLKLARFLKTLEHRIIHIEKCRYDKIANNT